jgi:hypothetical protein
MKFINKEMEPVRDVAREAIFVFIASISCGFVFAEFGGSIDGFLNIITENKVLDISSPPIFSGNAEF